MAEKEEKYFIKVKNRGGSFTYSEVIGKVADVDGRVNVQNLESIHRELIHEWRDCILPDSPIEKLVEVCDQNLMVLMRGIAGRNLKLAEDALMNLIHGIRGLGDELAGQLYTAECMESGLQVQVQQLSEDLPEAVKDAHRLWAAAAENLCILVLEIESIERKLQGLTVEVSGQMASWHQSLSEKDETVQEIHFFLSNSFNVQASNYLKGEGDSTDMKVLAEEAQSKIWYCEELEKETAQKWAKYSQAKVDLLPNVRRIEELTIKLSQVQKQMFSFRNQYGKVSTRPYHFDDLLSQQEFDKATEYADNWIPEARQNQMITKMEYCRDVLGFESPRLDKPVARTIDRAKKYLERLEEAIRVAVVVEEKVDEIVSTVVPEVVQPPASLPVIVKKEPKTPRARKPRIEELCDYVLCVVATKTNDHPLSKTTVNAALWVVFHANLCSPDERDMSVSRIRQMIEYVAEDRTKVELGIQIRCSKKLWIVIDQGFKERLKVTQLGRKQASILMEEYQITTQRLLDAQAKSEAEYAQRRSGWVDRRKNRRD